MAVGASVVLPLMAFAASVQGKRHIIHHWHGYGFLPGYHQPPNNSIPMFRSKESIRGTRDFAPSYWYGGGRYYFGEPHFSHGRWNGGQFRSLLDLYAYRINVELRMRRRALLRLRRALACILESVVQLAKNRSENFLNRMNQM
jgi:hypothetical protein